MKFKIITMLKWQQRMHEIEDVTKVECFNDDGEVEVLTTKEQFKSLPRAKNYRFYGKINGEEVVLTIDQTIVMSILTL